MIIVHGEMRCGTTWCAQMLSRVGNLGVVHEPYNPEWHKSDWIPDPETPKLFRKAWSDWQRDVFTSVSDLWFRLPYRNNETTREMSRRVKHVFEFSKEAYPDVQIQKNMLLPYFSEMREVWPDCKIVYIRRRLASWLSAVWRSEIVRNMVLYSDWQCGQPWDGIADEWAHVIGTDEPLRRKLLTLAAYYDAMTSFRELLLERELGGDYLGVDYEHLTGSYEIEMPRLFGYCGIPIPGADKLYELAGAVPRAKMDPGLIRAIHDVSEFVETFCWLRGSSSAARIRQTCT